MYQSRALRWLILGSFLVLFAPVLYGAKQAWDLQGNRVEDWLPASFEETKRLLWFVDEFGSDELLMVSWPDCTLDDERLTQLSKRLIEPVLYGGRAVCWYRHVWTGPDLLRTLQSEPLSLSQDEALKRMRGWLVGEDGRSTGAVAFVSADGCGNRHAAVEHLLQVAESLPGLDRDRIHIAGPTYNGVAIDNASKSSLLQFNLWSLLVCLAWMLIFLRSIKLAWYVFITAVFSQQLSMALMYASGQQMDSVLLMVGSLTFVLGIAGGVHLVNYYSDAARLGRQDAVRFAVGAASRPLLMASATTALATVSLTVSQITPIRNFGMYAAVSVLAGTVVLLVVLPTAIAQWPPKTRSRFSGGASKWLLKLNWSTLPRRLLQARWGLLLLAVALSVLGAAGVLRIRTSTRLLDLFDPTAKVIQDCTWLEENIGDLVPLEIVLRFPTTKEQDIDDKTAADRFAARMRFVEDVRALADATSGVGATISVALFAPPPPDLTKGGIRAGIERRIQARRFYADRDRLQTTGFYRVKPDEELWRISLRTSMRRDVDYGRLLRDLRSRLEPALSDVPDGPPPTMVLCGGVPLVHEAQRWLLHDLVVSFCLALVMIAAVMVVLLKSLPIGLLAMIPTVLPTLAVFGTMGWLGLNVELGSMLTASTALGVAVDDALHYITWFRRGLREGRNVVASTKFGYERRGAAMVQTSLICSLGLVVFALSPFTPIARFAWLMFTLLLLAMLCDLLILPLVLMIGSRNQSCVGDTRTGVQPQSRV